MRLVTAESAFYVSVYRHHDKSVFPEPGTYLDQPARYLDAMDTIEATKAEIEKAKADGLLGDKK